MVSWLRAETRGTGRSWPLENHLPSVAEKLASSQVRFPHMPTGSPRETHRISSPHSICSYREAPCSKGVHLRGLERVNPNETASQVLGVTGATRFLNRVWDYSMTCICLGEPPAFCFISRISVWLPEAKLISMAMQRKGDRLHSKPLTYPVRKCQSLL